MMTEAATSPSGGTVLKGTVLKKRRVTKKGPRALAKALKENDWTQRKLAAAIGVSPPTVSRWLSGERVPDRQHIKALWRLLKIPPEVWM